MASGLVYHNITTASGVSFTLGQWSPNTASPDTNALAAVVLTDGTNFAQFSPLGQTTSALSAPVVPPTDYGMMFDSSKIVAAAFPGSPPAGVVQPLFQLINVSTSGNNQIVAAVAGKTIRVLAGKVVASAAVNVQWQAATTPITGLSYFAAAGDGEVLPFNPVGWFQGTAVNQALNLNLSAAVTVGGHITYIAF